MVNKDTKENLSDVPGGCRSDTILNQWEEFEFGFSDWPKFPPLDDDCLFLTIKNSHKNSIKI